MKTKNLDRPLLTIVLILAAAGAFLFTSASFGLIARKGFSYKDVFFDQFVLGFILGIIALVLMIKIPIHVWQKYAVHIFVVSLLFTALVFVPQIGFEHGGAKRWISIGTLSFQPSEALKLATVVYFAALLARYKNELKNARVVFIIMGGGFMLPAILLLLEPDTGTFGVLLMATSAMFIVAGVRLRHFLLIVLFAVCIIGLLAIFRPYVKERLLTFVDPSRDPHGASYQLQRSLIAIGSGGMTGRGFGQSIQKFTSLPEPTGDSIFAVLGEEFGFIGGTAIIFLFLLFAIRGFHIAGRAPDTFSGLLAVGIVILIVSQSFANIGAMLGVIPLTGLPLVFISHGGTALLFAFIQIGILLNISTLRRT